MTNIKRFVCVSFTLFFTLTLYFYFTDLMGSRFDFVAVIWFSNTPIKYILTVSSNGNNELFEKFQAI